MLSGKAILYHDSTIIYLPLTSTAGQESHPDNQQEYAGWLSKKKTGGLLHL